MEARTRSQISKPCSANRLVRPRTILGSPTEDPFVNVNQYNYQDVSNWRDLNSKYVLMIWRDYAWSGGNDDAFLHYTWKAVKQAMEHLGQYDSDGDGLIENGGFPDQTYDNWVARGESAYSGGLYLAALRATAEIARKLGDSQTRHRPTMPCSKRLRPPTSRISGTALISITTRAAPITQT